MKTYLIIFLLLLAHSGGSQTYYEHVSGKDTVKLLTIENPTICDCVKKDYRNKDQRIICDKKYDKDFMSPDEMERYEKRAKICRYPSICDCAEANMNDKGLLKSCDEEYARYNRNSKDWEDLLQQIKNCKTAKKHTLESIQICDCYNVGRYDYTLNKLCQDKFWSDSINQENYALEMMKCISSKKTFLDPDKCDCARFANIDAEYKKACDKKFKASKLKGKELTAYNLEIEECIHNDVIEALYQKLEDENKDYFGVCYCFSKKHTLSQEHRKICMEAFPIEKLSIEQLKAVQFFAERCR